MELSLTELKKYCFKNYNVVLQDIAIKKMTSFKKVSHNKSVYECEPVIKWCEKYKDCIDNGYLRLGELSQKIKENYGLNVSSAMIYKQNPQVVKLSDRIVFVKDWERILNYYGIPRGQRRNETLLSMGTSASEISKKSSSNRSHGLNGVSKIAEILGKDFYTIKNVIKYLRLNSTEVINGSSYFDENSIEKIRVFFEKNSNYASLFHENTIKEKYGVENVSQIETVKEKKKETCLSHFGVDNYMKSEEAKNLFSKISKQNSNERIEKRKETLAEEIKKFENENDCISLQNLNKRDNLGYDKYGRISEVIHKLNLNYLVYKDNLFIKNDDIVKIYDYQKICHDHSTSYFENEIFNFVKSFCNDAENNVRNVIPPKELDVYVPSKNMAIECDGLYWHSDAMKDKNYHLNKTVECEKKGIRLLHIFEDDWLYKKDICKSIIKSACGIYERKIFARKCSVKKITVELARMFLKENHIQGYVNSNLNFGLFYGEDLVQVCSFGKSRFKNGEIELLRMATKLNTQVVGGFSKLINYAMNEMNVAEFISYVDRRLFNGKGYESCGFEKLGESEPSYFYIIGNKRENRMKFQKHKLIDVLKNFDECLSEKENMRNNGYYRIYDCGTIKMKFLKK